MAAAQLCAHNSKPGSRQVNRSRTIVRRPGKFVGEAPGFDDALRNWRVPFLISAVNDFSLPSNSGKSAALVRIVQVINQPPSGFFQRSQRPANPKTPR